MNLITRWRRASVAALVLAALATLTSMAAGKITAVGLTEPILDSTLGTPVHGIVAVRKVQEGDFVKKGDLLVELGSSKLHDQKIAQQIKVQNAEANFIRSRESLEVAKNQATADVAKAAIDAQFAKEDLKKYDDGDYPKLVGDANSKITIADEELKRAAEKLRWTEVLYAEKYVSQTELQADRLSKQKCELDLDVAKSALNLLKQYEYKRKVDELKSSVEQTGMALERAKRKASADVAQAQADLSAKESEMVKSKSQLEKTEKMIAASTGSCRKKDSPAARRRIRISGLLN